MAIPFSDRVPLVGQKKQFEVLSEHHTFVLRCVCGHDQVIVLLGEGEGPACPHCGSVPLAKINHLGFAIGCRAPNGAVSVN